MNTAFLRAVATGSLLVGLGVLLVGCAEDNQQTEDHQTILGSSGIGRSTSADGKKFEKSEDPPITADTRFAAGQLAESRGMQMDAIAQYQAALKLNPNHLPTLYRLAVVQTKMQQYTQAIQTWKTYVIATKELASAYGNLGFCYQVAGMPGEAESTYQRGIQRDPKDQTCRVNYGLLLVGESRQDEAIKQFEEVLSPAEAHYNVASVLEQQGHKEQAKVEYRKALAMDPSLLDAQKRLDGLK